MRWAIVLIPMIALTTGCASIVKGTTQTVPIGSDPEGADIIVNSLNVGTTPAEVELQRKRDHQITISKPGYAPATVPVLKSVGGAVWGNILAGGLIGWGVDAASGAQYNLKPETVFVRLRPLDGTEAPPEADDSNKGITRLRELDEARESGLISDEEYARGRERIITEFFPEMLTQ